MSPLLPCPPPPELEQFLLGRTEDEDSAALERHLVTCEQCQRQLSTLAAEDEFVQVLQTHGGRLLAGESGAGLPSAPEELVQLLTPQFKQIARALDGTQALPEPDGATRSFPGGGSPPPRREAVEPPIGEQLGRYEVRGVLGSGGMGTVLHAFDPLLKRSVAIKVIHARLLADPSAAARLMREAQAAAAIEHDQIVAVYAVELHEGRPCIAMPLLRGGTLKERLEARPGPWPLAEILRIGRETASGLEAAHAAGLIHCDIKPANLWLEAPGGRVKVLDFGLAIARDDQAGDSGAIFGTPGYMAPEQARGRPLDPRSDLFSLGCVLYQLATGLPPFTGPRRMRALWTVLSDPPPPVAQLNASLPSELSDLIRRLLAREPHDRPASAAEVVQALEALERRSREQHERTVKRRWLAALFVVALLSGGGAWWAMAVATAPPALVKVTLSGDEPPLAVLLRRDGQEQALTLGREKTLDLAPGDYRVLLAQEQPGRQLLPDHFAVLAGQPQTLRIALVGEVARHSTHSQAVTGVAVQPGGRRVFSVGLDRLLAAWEPASLAAPRFVNLPHAARGLSLAPQGGEVATAGGNKSPPAELAIRNWQTSDLAPRGSAWEGHTRLVLALAYAPVGQQLASAGADGVLIWNTRSGVAETLPEETPAVIYALAWSADGRRLLTGGDEGQVTLWDVAARRPLQSFATGPAAVRAVAFLADRLVTAGDDGVIRIWNAGALQHEWLSDGGAVLALAVSPDGRQLLAGDAAGGLRVWSIARGRITSTLHGHQRAVQAVAYEDSGRLAVSGGADGVVCWWRLPFSD